MRIAAYITLRHDYFLFHVRNLLALGVPVEVIPLHEWLLAEREPPTEERWKARVQTCFEAFRPDVLWTYNRPDEVTEHVARAYRIPVLTQEHFGRHPDACDMLFPLRADLRELAGRLGIRDEPRVAPGGQGAPLCLTLAFSLSRFHHPETIPSAVARMAAGSSVFPLATYWRESPDRCTHMNTLRLVMHALQCMQADWRLFVRVHPRYRHVYAGEIAWIEREQPEHVLLDDRSIQQCLDETDIMICTTSNMGADALRAGCRVITLEQRAFFAHPHLTESPRGAGELQQALGHAYRELQHRGRCVPAPLRALMQMAAGPLASTTAPRQMTDTIKLLDALQHGARLPALACS